MECMREETFGPTLPIMKVADVEEAVRSPTTRPTACRRASGRSDIAARRADRPPARGRRRLRQRCAGQLLRAEPADGRLEGLGHRHPPRRERDPQVLQVQSLLVTRRRPNASCSCSPTRLVRRCSCDAPSGCSTGAARAIDDAGPPSRAMPRRRASCPPSRRVGIVSLSAVGEDELQGLGARVVHAVGGRAGTVPLPVTFAFTPEPFLTITVPV